MNKLYLSFLLGAVGAFGSIQAQQTLGEIRTDYMFPVKETPVGLSPYSHVVFSYGPHLVSNMRGHVMHDFGKSTIEGVAVSPAGNIFAAITTDKKGNRSLEYYSLIEEDAKLGNFDVKRYGNPLGVVFTPDARGLLVVTDLGLFVVEPQKFKVVERYEMPFKPGKMVVSPNGYLLAMTDGDKLGIYNLTDHKMRQTRDLGEQVTDVAFTADNQTLGVLTSDGVLSLYDGRTLTLRNSVEDLGEGLGFRFNDTGKYIGVATNPTTVEVVNLLRQEERSEYERPGDVRAVEFLLDAKGHTLLANTGTLHIDAKRLTNLEPYFARLVADGADKAMDEWLKMMPGETMDQYALRVNDETRRRQRRLFEDEISTSLAGDPLSMATISLGNYDRSNEVLEIGFDNMPTIYLPVPQADVVAFNDIADLEISDAKYGLLPNDNFEIVYAKIRNKADGKTYVYDNVDRVQMNFMGADDNVVSLDILRQQQMEEIKLEELRQKVVAEAKHDNVISDHTQITVDSKVVPDYDAQGNRILNYVVKFNYQVDPGFSATEDFKPGKYTVDASGAATSMLKIVKEALEGDFSQYLRDGKRLKVDITGTADSTPIVGQIIYDGSYGDFEAEPVYQNGTLAPLSIVKGGRVGSNEQLALLRAAAVKDYLEKNIRDYDKLDKKYNYFVNVSEGKGAEFRRITAEFTFFDAF